MSIKKGISFTPCNYLPFCIEDHQYSNGAVMKAVMIDEGMESISVSLNGLVKGIYQCVIENRTQRFGKCAMLR